MDTETGEMIVKRVSVPIGLEELMEGLVKEVLLKKPDDIYQFAARYFAHLLTVRDKVPVNKVKTLRSVQTIKAKPEKPPIHTKTSKLSKQFSIREDSAPLDSPIISQKPKMYQRNELKYNKRRHTGPSTVIPNNQQLTIRRKYAKSVSGEIENPATVSNNNKSKNHTRRERSSESVDRSTKTMNERNYSKLPILAENNIAKITENNNNNDTDETNNKSNTETEENSSRDENNIVEKKSIETTKEEDNINKESLQKDEDSGKDNVDEEENDLKKNHSIKLEHNNDTDETNNKSNSETEENSSKDENNIVEKRSIEITKAEDNINKESLQKDEDSGEDNVDEEENYLKKDHSIKLEHNNETDETNNKYNTETEENSSKDENNIVEKRSIEITKAEDNINKESLQKDEYSCKDNVDEEENGLQKDNSIKLEDSTNVSQKSENTSAEKRETYILTPSRTIDDEEVSRVLLSSISNTENSTVDISELQNATPKNPSAIDESKLDENDEKEHKMDETNIDTKENDQFNNEEELKVDHTIKTSKNDDENNQLKAEVKTLEEDQVSDKKGSKMDTTKTEIKEKEEIKIDDPVTTGKNDRETKIIEGELSEDSLELDEEKEKEEKPSISPELSDITHNLLITEDAIKENEAGKNVDNKPEELIKESENFTEETLEDITENVAFDKETKKLEKEVNDNIANDLPISGIDHSLKSHEESVDTKKVLEDNLSASSEPCNEKTDLKVNSVKEKNIEIETVPDTDKETTEDVKTEEHLKKEELSEETDTNENITKENLENTDADINNSNKFQNNAASEQENVKYDNIKVEKDLQTTTTLQVTEKENNNEENDIKISNKHDNADNNNADKEIRNINDINEVNEKSTKQKLEKMITFDVEDNNKKENVINKFEKMATIDGGFLNNKRDSDEMIAKNNLEKMKTFDVADITDKDSSLPLEIPAKNTENLEKIILKENSIVSQETNVVSEKIKVDKKIEEVPKLLNATLPTNKDADEEEANITEKLDEGDANDKIKDEIIDEGNKFKTTIENITKIGDNDELMNKEQSEKDGFKKENDKIEETTDENIKTTKFVATISNNQETETNNNKNENINDTESKNQLKKTFNNMNKIEEATVNNETNESGTGENKESFDDVKICSDEETKSRVNMDNEKKNQSFETGNNKTDNANEIKEAIDAKNINEKEEINSLETVGTTEQTVNDSDYIEVPKVPKESIGDVRINQDQNIKIIETKEIGDSIKATEKPSDQVDSHNGNGENKTDNIEDNNQINTNENRTKRSVSFEESPKNKIDNNNAIDADDKDEDTYSIKSKSESDNNLVDRVAKNYVNYVIDNDRYLVNDTDNSAIDEIDLDNETETKSDELINENSDNSTIESPGKNKQSIESYDATGVVKNEEEIVEDTSINKKDEEEDRRDAKYETNDVSNNNLKSDDKDVERKENETEHSTETTSNEIINSDNSNKESTDNSKHSIERDNVAGVKVEEQMVEDTAIVKKDKEEDRRNAKDEMNEVSSNNLKSEDKDLKKKENEAKHSTETTSNDIMENPGNSKHIIDGEDAALVKVEEKTVEDTAIDKQDKEEDIMDPKDETKEISNNKLKVEDEDIGRKENEAKHSTETKSNDIINTDNSIIESPGNSKQSIDGDDASVVKIDDEIVEDTGLHRKDNEEDRRDAKDENNDVSSNKSKIEEEEMINSIKIEDQMVEETDINEKDKEEDRIHAKQETNEDVQTSSNNTKSVDEDTDRNESVKTAAENLIQSTLSIAETSLIEHKVKTFLNDFIDKEKNNVPSTVEKENKHELIEEMIRKNTAPLQNIKPFNKTMSSDSINMRPVNGLKKTVSFDSSKLRNELKKIEEESKFTSFKSSYNPFLLRKEIEDATEKKANDGLVLTSMNFTKVVNATLRIQRFWRRYKNRKSVEATMENKESNQLGDFVSSANAALIIQKMWRGFKARKAFKSMKNNVASKESSTKAEIDEESEENCTMIKENPDTTEEENATEERRLFSAESTGSVNTVIFNDPKDDSKTNLSFHNEYYSGEVGNILDEILDYPTVEEEYLLDNYQSKLLDKISGKEEDNKFDDIKAYEKIVSPKRIDDINLEPLKDEVHVPLLPKPVDKNERKLTRSLSSKLEILEEESATPEEEEDSKEHMKDSDVQTEGKLYTFCSEPAPIPCEKKLIDVLSQNVTEEAGNRKQETLVIPLPKNKLKNNEKQEICDITNLDDISSILSNAGIDCGEIHDTVVVPINEQHVETGRSHPISVQLYQTSGQVFLIIVLPPFRIRLDQDAENLMTSPSTTDVTGGRAARDAENAQDPEKADLRVDSQFVDDVLSGSPPHSMESEKRRKIDGAIMEAQAATKIQAGFRGYQVRKQLKLKNGSSDMTNSKKSTRSKSTGSLDASNNQSQKPEKIEEQSAVKIQAGIRGFLVRRRQKKVSSKQA